MTKTAGWTSPLGAAAAAALLLGAQPVLAETSDSLGQRVTDAFNEAVEAGRAEHYQAACRGFNSAAGLYKNAIYALMAEPMGTDKERDYVKRQANALQDRVDTAKEYAQVVCPLSDGPSGDDTASTSDTGDDNAATKEDLLLLEGQYTQFKQRSRFARIEAEDELSILSPNRTEPNRDSILN